MRTFLVLTTTYYLLSSIPAYSSHKTVALALETQQRVPCTLKSPTPKTQISATELAFWDTVVQNLPEEMFAEKGGKTRLYAYLSNAQKSFAEASLAISGSYAGSLDPVSLYIIRLFNPDYHPNSQISSDPFSHELAQEIVKDYKTRFEKEEAQTHPYAIPDWDDRWQGINPYIGLSTPTMKPWFLESASEFRLYALSPPQDSFWKNQIDQVTSAMKKTTSEQKQRILFWAGMIAQDSNDWRDIAAKYMAKKNTPLKKQLEVRACLGAGLFDALIATFDSKYTYWIKRPSMMDPSIKTFIPVPNHPSYPSAHSSTGQTAAAILSYYFPENQQKWESLAEEAGLSRIWAGIHFPIDHEAGKKLGSKVGKLAISKCSQPSAEQQFSN